MGLITGIDLASEPDQAGLAIYGARRHGKHLVMDKIRDDYLKRHPDAVVMTVYTDGEVRIERPVKQVQRKLLK